MKYTLSEYDLKEMFVKWDRNYYSMDGIRALLDYYDSIDENMEVDIVSICCDCTEYGETQNGETGISSFDSLISDYGYKYPIDEYMEDNEITEKEFNQDEYIEELIETLESYTTVLTLDNGNYIVFSF